MPVSVGVLRVARGATPLGEHSFAVAPCWPSSSWCDCAASLTAPLAVDAEITTVLAKRGTGDRPPSSSSNSSSRSASSTSHHAGQPQGECVAASPRMPHGQGRLDKRPKGGMLAGFLLR